MAAPAVDELPINEVENDDKAECSDSDGGTSGSKPVDEPPLSKSQLKKIRKRERWNEIKAQKRKAEKERYKARKRECRERGEDFGPSRKQLRHNTMSKSSCKIRVAVDCDFDEYMVEKDIKMLVKQIQFSYSANRRAENPLQFYCCGVNGKTKERLESLGDYKGWDINFHSENYLDMFDKSTVVYLSSESPNILEKLDEDKVYIIGGLVDHNHHKGLCHSLAEEKGVEHAQLPISEYIDMKTRKVLTVNHVFDILLQFTITKDWQKAFYTILPPRKGAVPKVVENTDCNVDTLKADGEEIDDDFEEKKNTEQSCDLYTATTESRDVVERSKNEVVNDSVCASEDNHKECEVTNGVKNVDSVDNTQVVDNSNMTSTDKS